MSKEKYTIKLNKPQTTFFRHLNARKEDGSYKNKAVMLCGGVGVGKSAAGALRLLQDTLTYKAPSLICSPTYRMMIDATLASAKRIYKTIGVECEIMGGGTRFRLGVDDDGKPIDHYLRTYEGGFEKLYGIEVVSAWFDEGTLANAKYFNTAIGRLRGKRGSRQIYITSTPSGMDWTYDEFVQKQKDDRAIVYGSIEANRENLPSDYIDDLRNSYSSELQAQYLDGQYIPLSGEVFSRFPIVEYTFNPDKKIYISLDFGKNHSVAQFWQPQAHTFGESTSIRYVCFDYVAPTKMTTRELCQEIGRKLHKYGRRKPNRIACDPAGNNETSNVFAGVSDVNIVRNYFNVDPEFQTSKALRSRRTRCEFLNHAFQKGFVAFSKEVEFSEKDHRDFMSPVESLRKAVYSRDESGAYEKGEKGGEADHHIDAMSYGFSCWEPERFLANKPIPLYLGT